MEKLKETRDTIPFRVRMGEVSDLPFIYDSWMQSLKFIYPHKYDKCFSKNYAKIINILLDKSCSLVAHLEGERDEILSYLIYTSFEENMVIHFGYTKADCRREGKLRELLHFANPLLLPVVFTHPAKNENVMEYLCRKFIYDPSIIGLLE